MSTRIETHKLDNQAAALRPDSLWRGLFGSPSMGGSRLGPRLPIGRRREQLNLELWAAFSGAL
jgi:hypothetical protein